MPKTIEQYREEFEDAHRGAGDLLERLWEMWVEQFHPTLVGLELIDPQWAPTPQPVIDRVGLGAGAPQSADGSCSLLAPGA